MTTEIHVVDETGDANSPAAQIREILTASAPVMEQVTGLRLPVATYHLLHHRGFVERYRINLVGAYGRDTEGYELNLLHSRIVQDLPHALARSVGKHWTLIEPEAVTDRLFRPAILIAVDAWAHQGVLSSSAALHDRLLCSLAYLAQITASSGEVAPQKVWPSSAAHRGHPARQLIEGHARWVADTATPIVLGGPSGKERLDHSRLYRRQSLLPDTIDCGRGMRRVRRAADFVSQAVAGCGTDRFNAVWHAPDLVPTPRELKRPHEWLRRTAPAPGTAAGPALEPGPR
ncbi:zinc-dependent metalloprotease [Streptomyces sp. BE147]|uniref:zinc-dependent metalloprotease n=1 Tax=Streptomyces sp. BE147 TaxID=3002524 RepID=UPI002E766E5E|nr:zinc-dependent metalloprotease [Streptomyces sp. BE147]MEE1736485.1 zinc-dependent metalloprotease [Streptomyces sp. BE147]